MPIIYSLNFIWSSVRPVLVCVVNSNFKPVYTQMATLVWHL